MVDHNKLAPDESRKVRRLHEQEQRTNPCQLADCMLCKLTLARHSRTIPLKPRALRDGSTPRQHIRTMRATLDGITFQGAITITARDLALKTAAEEVWERGDPSRLVYWTGGFPGAERDTCGIGVVYHDEDEGWKEVLWRKRESAAGDIVKMYAIAQALEVARDQWMGKAGDMRPSEVVIYSDCVAALRRFERYRESLFRFRTILHGLQVIGPGLVAADELSKLEVSVELRWVPRNAGVEGNLKARWAAKKAGKIRLKNRTGLIISNVINESEEQAEGHN